MFEVKVKLPRDIHEKIMEEWSREDVKRKYHDLNIFVTDFIFEENAENKEILNIISQVMEEIERHIEITDYEVWGNTLELYNEGEKVGEGEIRLEENTLTLVVTTDF